MKRPNFIKINAKRIENILSKNSRQYLVGNLQLPQELKYIQSKDVEIGISYYDKYTIEEAHFHTQQTEYQYMISGKTEYKNINTDEIFIFKKGDFYCIETGTKYAQRIYNNTTILFIKLPAINDKQLVKNTEKLEKWFNEHLNNKIRRKDHFFNDSAPKPNSLVPAVAAAIIENDKILLIRRVDNDMWSLPGGTLEFGESLEECLIREVKEETGLNIKINNIENIYSNPNILIEYANGEVRQEFTTVYSTTQAGGELKIDNESKDIKWISLDDALKLKMAKSQRVRIENIVNRSKIIRMCKINLENNIEEQVQECINKGDIGPSPSEGKIYICTSVCFDKIEITNKKKLKNQIVKKLKQLDTNKKECVISISIGPAPKQNQKHKKSIIYKIDHVQ